MLPNRCHCVYVGRLLSWWNRHIIRVVSAATNHPQTGLAKITDQSYDRCSSFCGPLGILQEKVLLYLCTVFRFHDACVSLLLYIGWLWFVYVCVVVRACVFHDSLKFEGWTMMVMAPQQYFHLRNCACSAVQSSPGNSIFVSCWRKSCLSWFLVGLAEYVNRICHICFLNEGRTYVNDPCNLEICTILELRVHFQNPNNV